MRSVNFTAIKIGVVGAVLLLSLFSLTSWWVNNELEYYAHYRKVTVHDTGFFEVMLFIFTIILLVMGAGPVAVLVVRRNIVNIRGAVGVSFSACTTLILASLASIITYVLILSIISVYPYFSGLIVSQVSISPLIIGTAFLLILLVGMIVSTLCGCLTFVAIKPLKWAGTHNPNDKP